MWHIFSFSGIANVIFLVHGATKIRYAVLCYYCLFVDAHRKKSTLSDQQWLTCQLESSILITMLFPSLTFPASVLFQNYCKVLLFRATTPFRLSEVLFPQSLLCSICRVAVPQWIYPSSFMPVHSLQQCILSFMKGKQNILEVMTKKVCKGGYSHIPLKSGCPLQKAFWKWTLSIACSCSLITIFMSIPYSQKPIQYE